MLKLRLVRHTIHFAVNRTIVLSVWFTCVLHYAIGLHEFVTIFLAFAMIFYAFIIRAVVQPYTICGAIHFDESTVRWRYKNGEINEYQYRKVTFVNGGYCGKYVYGLYLFYRFTDFKSSKDGVSNFLVFDDDPTKKLQIMLHDKREYRALLAYLEKLRDLGKDVVVTNYMLYQIKTYLKQIKRFIHEISMNF